MLNLKNISKHYHSKKGQLITALDDVSLSIKQGEIFAIIGGSGAGKSTLLRCMNVLEVPSSGEVSLNGVNLINLPMKTLRKQRQRIGMIFQHFNLINNKTVFENIALPLRINGNIEKLTSKVEEMLQLVELSDKKTVYPHQLSGGQKQRVAIARALIAEPELLLCDEATSALDPNTTQEVLTLLQKINKKMQLTIVLVTHEMEVVRQICHRFAELREGKLIEVASLEKIFQNHPKSHLLLDGLKPSLPEYLKQKLVQKPKPDHYPLCQIMFYGDVSQQAIISHISQKYQLQLNILQANIDVIGQHTFGILVVQIKGKTTEIDLAFDYFSTQNLQVEILGYVE